MPRSASTDGRAPSRSFPRRPALVAAALVVAAAATTAAQEVDFAAPLAHGSPYAIGGVLPADIDGDGLLDVVAAVTAVVGSNRGDVAVYRGHALLGLSSRTAYPGIEGVGLAIGADLVDLDGNGRPDVVLGHSGFSGAAGLTTHLDDGAGGFRAPAFLPLPFHVRSVLAANLDGDAAIDVIASGSSGHFATLLSDGAGGSIRSRSSSSSRSNRS